MIVYTVRTGYEDAPETWVDSVWSTEEAAFARVSQCPSHCYAFVEKHTVDVVSDEDNWEE